MADQISPLDFFVFSCRKRVEVESLVVCYGWLVCSISFTKCHGYPLPTLCLDFKYAKIKKMGLVQTPEAILRKFSEVGMLPF